MRARRHVTIGSAILATGLLAAACPEK